MDINSDSYQEDVELGILKKVLEPYSSYVAEIKVGYELLRQLVTLQQNSRTKTKLQMSQHYRKLVDLIKKNYTFIEDGIDALYENGDRNEFPAFFIHPHIFDGELYFPFERLSNAKNIDWTEVDSSLTDCQDRINVASELVLYDRKTILLGNDVLTEVDTYLSEISQPLRCGDLTLDLTKCTIQYKDNEPISVVIDSKEIRLLELLIRNCGSVVRHLLAASKLELNSRNSYTNDKEAGEESIRYIKSSLHKILKSAGVSKDEFDRMIKTQKNTGYVLND